MILSIRVHPRSSQQRLERHDDGTWSAWLRSPPVDGKANAELIKLVAAEFGVPKSSVRVKLGASGRSKLVEIDDP